VIIITLTLAICLLHTRYLRHGKELQPLFAMTTHDYSIKDALYDYLEVRLLIVCARRMEN
jgi:hypothetical protein